MKQGRRCTASRSQLRKSLMYSLLDGQHHSTYRSRGKGRRSDRVYFRPHKVRMPLYEMLQFPSKNKIIVDGYEFNFLPLKFSIWGPKSEFRTIIIRKMTDNRTEDSLKELLAQDHDTITLDDYQRFAVGTAIYGAGQAIIYPVLGLTNEAGEVAGKVKKVLRDNGGMFGPKEVDGIVDELGDVLWYLAATARDLNMSLESIARRNLTKLADRKARNVIQGSGDQR